MAALAGGLLLLRPEGTYLGLILVWAAPVLALQWAYAGTSIWARRRAWAMGVAVPTLYLWIVDAIAIDQGIWHISETYTLGPAVGPLPLEEAVFFLVTNLLVVQGLLLFLHPPNPAASRWEVKAAPARASGDGRPAATPAADRAAAGGPARERPGPGGE
jgi:lycopene cyclase domain-containing protein